MRTINDYLSLDVEDIVALISFVLNENKSFIYANPQYILTKKQRLKLNLLIKRRINGEPFAYITGIKGFYHLNLKVNKHTLIPRPETELIVDIALDLLPNTQAKIIDLGTGSGAIAITLKSKRKLWQVVATDISYQALIVAKKNALNNNCDIEFICGNWFESIANNKFDLIVSNPPYIEKNDKHLNNLAYEPMNALVSGYDGLDDIRNIINKASEYLSENGYLLLEHGFNQQDKIAKLLKNNFINIKSFKDINNVPRCVLAQNIR